MLTRADVMATRGELAPLELFRKLGYPIDLVPIDAAEWRRAGIDTGWNGSCDWQLAARLRRFDLFWLAGAVEPEAVARFLRITRSTIRLLKSVVLFQQSKSDCFSIYDLSSRQALRRLDIDLSDPSPYVVDRLNLLAPGKTDPTPLFDLALDRELLTRRFFTAFRDAVRQVELELALAADGESAEAVAGQAVLVLSRLLFLSFVQKKGWLNGERRFLFDRIDGHDLHRTLLTPLFFGCLNTPSRDRDLVARRLGRIPYLNGGLFEPSGFERRNGEVVLPDHLLRRIVIEVFERFDFSVEEHDSAGTHVDPEMLGKVFESLMAPDERAATGSFYTPKEIVDVLTERSIREWAGRGDPLETLGRLESITVLDPACGSGAFLLSALGAIERLTGELSERAGVAVPRDLRQRIVERSLFGVDLKPEAVRLCELRLWLAIVAQSECTIEEVKPLPNLDRNILQGNSLLSPTDFLGDARADIYRSWVYALRAQSDLVARYRTSKRDERPALARLIRENDRRLAGELLTAAIEADEGELQRLVQPQPDLFGRARSGDRGQCQELRERIERNQRSLRRLEEGAVDFFSFDVHFAPVMSAGGFDVVVGNPPWVRNARIPKAAKQMLADRYRNFREKSGAGFHQPDLAVAFIERSLALTANAGVVSMLVPSKLLTAGYAGSLRRELLRHDVIAIDDWSGGSRRHFGADTFPLALTVGRRAATTAVSITDAGRAWTVGQNDLAAGNGWVMVPPDVAAILTRLRGRFPTLSEALGRRPLMGVKTGDNGVFFLGEAEVDDGKLVTSDGLEIPLSAVARCVRGRDVKRWSASDGEWMLWPPRGGWRRSPQWLTALASKRGVPPERLRLAFVKPEHSGIKVVWKDVSRGMAAAVMGEHFTAGTTVVPLVPNQTLYVVEAASVQEALAISAVLNSSVVDALLVASAERAKDAHFRYFGRTVGAIPFPRLARDAQTALARLARGACRNPDFADVGGDVDRAVAELYGLSRRELSTLRDFAEWRLERDAG